MLASITFYAYTSLNYFFKFYPFSSLFIVISHRGVARSRHDMVEGRIQGIKSAGESKVERPCRGTGAKEEGMAEYATERHIFT